MMSEVCCQNDITDETKDFFVVLKGKANNDLIIKWNGAAISSLECLFFLLESIFEKSVLGGGVQSPNDVIQKIKKVLNNNHNPIPNQQWFPQHQETFKSLRESCWRCLHSRYKVQKFSIESNPIKLSVNETVWKGLRPWTRTTNPWNIATGEKRCLEQSWSFEKRVPMIPYWWDGHERLCWIVDGLLKTSEFLLHVKQREDKIIQIRDNFYMIICATWRSKRL